jgi:hypothetical protein
MKVSSATPVGSVIDILVLAYVMSKITTSVTPSVETGTRLDRYVCSSADSPYSSDSHNVKNVHSKRPIKIKADRNPRSIWYPERLTSALATGTRRLLRQSTRDISLSARELNEPTTTHIESR